MRHALRVFVILLLASPLFGQGLFFSTAPLGGKRYEVKEVLGTSAIGICGGHNLAVVRTSATQLTLANGAAAATPQYVLWPTFTKSYTAAITATIAGGSGNGTAFFWAQVVGTTVTVYSGNNVGATITCAGACTDAGATSAYPNGPNIVPLWAWSLTGAQFDASNTASGDGGVDRDCWVDFLTFSNVTATAATVTVTDGLSPSTALYQAYSVPANSTVTVPLLGGMVFRGGLYWTAGTASAINGYARLVRQMGPSTAP